MKRFAPAALLAAALCLAAAMPAYAAQDSPVLENIPAGEYMTPGEEIRFGYNTASGEPLGEEYTLSLSILEGEEYMEKLDVVQDGEGRWYLEAEASEEEFFTGVKTARWRVSCRDAEGRLTASVKQRLDIRYGCWDVVDDEITVSSSGGSPAVRADRLGTEMLLTPLSSSLVFHSSVEEVTLHFDSYAEASFTVELGDTRRAKLYYDDSTDSALDVLIGPDASQTEVLRFGDTPEFQNAGTMKIRGGKYLYRYENGALNRISSEYEGGVHTFSTRCLGWYVLSDNVF